MNYELIKVEIEIQQKNWLLETFKSKKDPKFADGPTTLAFKIQSLSWPNIKSKFNFELKDQNIIASA
jgi:hypothetical protein